MLLTCKDFPKMKSSSKIFGTSHLALHACLALLWLCELRLSNSADTLSVGQSMRDWQVLESQNKHFQLIFFNPVFTDNHYLGVRFVGSFNYTKEVWVANRESPLSDSSGYLNITQDGYLAIGDKSGTSIIINQGNPAMGSNASVTLLDSGNLVLRSGERVVWQSFDHPTDTILPGMKIGLFELNRKQPRKRFLTSWVSPGVPYSGAFTLGVFPGNIKQIEVRRRGAPFWRSGREFFGYFPLGISNNISRNFMYTWINESNSPFGGNYNASLNLMYTSNENESYFSFSAAVDRQSWIEMNINFFYSSIGFATSGSLVFCDGQLRNRSKGCVEERWPKCSDDDEFARIVGKMDTWTWSVTSNFSEGLSDCERECRIDCTCTAYSSQSADGSGCRFSYHGKLIDALPEYSESFYIRNSTAHNDTREAPKVGNDSTMPLSNPPISQPVMKESSIKKRVWVIVVATLVPLCSACSFSYLIWKCYFRKVRETGSRRTEVGKDTEKFMNDLGTNITTEDESAIRSLLLKGRKDHELPLFSFSSIETATQHFSEANKLGQGGFGPVYKGTLEDGNEVAIKRLSERSVQGDEEFKNEVVLISKVQHKNLVRLFGCCIKGVEKLLVYEYLPNKSLDTFIFADETKRGLLNWRMRINIIEGIAQGLLYLHKYSRLKIIHRDLKSSNILLDDNMSPKISDFGTAKIFGENESRANTNRIVGTFGYMSPEYAMDGLFSAKSDVFSFGVMILEIISGKKNTGFYQSDRSLNLVRHAWNLWNEGKDLELMDTTLEETCPANEFTKSVQIALLCVQENAEDRPTMSEVVSMFGSESIILSEPKQFSFSTFLRESENQSPCNSIADSNPSNYTT